MGIFDYWKKEKAKPDFSNVRSGGSSTAAAPAPVPQADGDSFPAGSVDTHTYVVVKGDSLSKIASGAVWGRSASGAGSTRRTATSSRTPTSSIRASNCGFRNELKEESHAL